MPTATLGRTESSVSRLGLGTAGFVEPRLQGDSRAIARLVGAFLDSGGTVFDTADSYGAGAAETALGKALGNRRGEAFVCTKVGWPTGPGPEDAGLSPAHIRRAVDASLRRLATDHIDLYQLHLFDDDTPIEATMGALDECVRAGKVRYVGASAFHAWQLADANRLARERGLPRLDSVQLTYNLVRRDIEDSYLSYCAKDEVSIVVYSPLQGGLLSGAVSGDMQLPASSRLRDPYLRQMYRADDPRSLRIAARLQQVGESLGASPGATAIAWLLAQAAVTCVLLGPETDAELADCLGGLDVTLDPSAAETLDEVSRLPPRYPADFYARKPQTMAFMREKYLTGGATG